jgi:hypothetical protein
MPPDNARGDYRRHAIAGIPGRRKAHQQYSRRCRLWQNAHGDFRDDPKQPFGSGHQAEHVLAIGIEVLPAKADHFAIHQNDLDAQEVVGGDPVFEAMDAARILGNVAADRAGDLA